ncbi:hypothetical protein W893_14870, partial [Staphylococcus aureus subsp. aureus ST 1413]
KSTLIRMFNHLEAPTSGEVIIDGDHIGQLSKNGLRAKRQKVSMIFQHFNLLWSRTVLKNIMFPLEIAGVPRRRAKQKALELVELVGLKGREYDEIKYEFYEGIAKVTINRPEVRNAFTPKTVAEMIDAFSRARDDQNVSVIVLTGEGDLAFCSGGDQKKRGHGGYVGEDQI